MTLSNIILLATEVEEADISWSEAGLNTAMGIGIVFITLVFISFIIMLEGKIFGAINKKKSAPKVVEAPKAAEVVEEAVDENGDALAEEEIAAVISAAIYAYESENGAEVPADGLVVRSIRRLGYAR